jgi:SH3 domain protein
VVVLRALLLLLVSIAASQPARADYVRDEIRVHIRTGPGAEYSPLKLLRSGDEVTRLERRDEWSRVRTPDGQEGWLPTTYLAAKRPPSAALPQTEARLRLAEDRVRDLEKQLGTQAERITEVQTLKDRVRALEAENIRLEGSTRWKELLAGGGIVLLGMAVGALVARGGSSRSRRLKI